MKTTKIFAHLFMVWVILSAIACFAQKSPDITVNEKAIREYYSAYETMPL